MHLFQFWSQLKVHKACQIAVPLIQLCLKLKLKQIFASAWTAIDFGFDVPVSGYVSLVNFLGIPLVVVRSRSGEIKMFENVCRHNGMILVEEAKKLRGPITCPYHAWAYDFNGTLEDDTACRWSRCSWAPVCRLQRFIIKRNTIGPLAQCDLYKSAK